MTKGNIIKRDLSENKTIFRGGYMELEQSIINRFKSYLIENEKTSTTIEKYIREVKRLLIFLNNREPTKSLLLEYREILKQQHKAQTVNSKLSAINSFLYFSGYNDRKIRFLKVQRKAFIEANRELTEREYRNLLMQAQRQGNDRLYYIMMTICSTGIRISELKYITVNAIKCGQTEISLKGKNRTIILPKELRQKLLIYCKSKNIQDGYVFQTKNGLALDRSNIWHEMKKLCKTTNIDPNKVFPHNLRHLFARVFYAVEKNLAHLADILGHSSIETTRIYVGTSISEYERTLRKMKLII